MSEPPEDKGYVYFARPVDFANLTGDHLAFQAKLEVELANAGYTVYHPAYAWKINGPMNESLARCVDSTNRFALRRAKAVVAWLPEGVLTQGVPMEIEFATKNLGLPVIVFGHVGACVRANSMVSVLAESDMDKVGRQLDLLIPDFEARNTPTIRYSGPHVLEHAHPGDAGMDLRASEDVLIESGSQAFVPSGIRISIPSTLFGWIVARSSTFGQHGLMVLPGIIDSGFQGELGISCVNATTLPVRVRKGDRLGQLLLLANMWPGFQLNQTEEENVFPNPSPRGTNRFGSSGR